MGPGVTVLNCVKTVFTPSDINEINHKNSWTYKLDPYYLCIAAQWFNIWPYAEYGVILLGT